MKIINKTFMAPKDRLNTNFGVILKYFCEIFQSKHILSHSCIIYSQWTTVIFMILLCTSYFKSPTPLLGHERGKSGAFVSDSLHFGSPLGGGCARNHGLRMSDRGISGAVSPCLAVLIIYVDSLGRSVALRYFASIRCL